MMIYIISLKNMIRNNEVYVMQMSKLSTRQFNLFMRITRTVSKLQKKST